MGNTFSFIITSLLIILTHQTGFNQTIWYVTPAGAGLKDGTSWSNATDTLQHAIDSAMAGDQIWIAAGTYYPTAEFNADGIGASDNRERTFYINKNIKIYGGFSGVETALNQRSDANIVILSGDIDMVAEREDFSENSYHVLFIDGTTNPIDTSCRLEGLTIQFGRALAPINFSNTYIHEKGAGVYLDGSNGGTCSPTFMGCDFYNNVTDLAGYGGHMFNNGEGGDCSPIIESCTFSQSYARYGGAIYQKSSMGQSAPVIRHCQFMINAAGYGGAIYDYANGGTGFLQVSNCEFVGNFGNKSKGVNGEGAGIYLFINSGAKAPVITNSYFKDNNAGSTGGGIYTTGTSIISNCQFISNEGAGGGIANFHMIDANHTLITNCSFYGNNKGFGSQEIGGSLHNFGPSSKPRIANCILWQNNDEVFNPNGAVPTFTNCIIEGSGGSTAWVDSFGIDGGNNLDVNPMFAADTNNLKLMAASPGIDAGVNDSLPIGTTTDYDGNPRIVDGTVDMGAFEYQNCHNALFLDETDSPLIGSYFANSSITIDGNSPITTQGYVFLNAPTVLFNSEIAIEHVDLLEIKAVGCP